jgi:hypothetical protein
MKGRTFSIFWPLICCALLLALIAQSGRLPLPRAAAVAGAQDACPPGQTPLEFVSLADVLLDKGAPPYATMALSRIVLGPGETLDVTPAGYTAYYVESGNLKYAFQPGFEIRWTPKCSSPDGHFSGGGITQIDDEGMMSVNQGESLDSDVVPTGPITNGGSAPLVMLQMTLVLPEIDPATGLPIVDPFTAGRIASREFEQIKQACKVAASLAAAGTPAAAVMAKARIEALATPAVSTAGWESDARDRSPKIPKACRDAEGR